MDTMTTDNDPLTEHEEMRSIHHHGSFWLFSKDGKPQVLYRRRFKKDGVYYLDCEWGDLDHKRFSADRRREFVAAWEEYQSWKRAMS